MGESWPVLNAALSTIGIALTKTKALQLSNLSLKIIFYSIILNCRAWHWRVMPSSLWLLTIDLIIINYY